MHAKSLNRQKAEAECEDDLFAFRDLSSLEAQMQSLKSKGFLRFSMDTSRLTNNIELVGHIQTYQY